MENSNLWNKLIISEDEKERVARKNTSFVSDVFYRFRKKTTAVIGVGIVIVLLIFAIFGPYFTKYTYKEQNLDFVNIPPTFKAYELETENGKSYVQLTEGLKVIEVSNDGQLIGSLTMKDEDSANKKMIYEINGTDILLDYAVKPQVMTGPNGEQLSTKFMFNKTYILGTDSMGRDMLTRLMYGARISLLVAFIAAVVNLIIGVIYGGISGYVGGKVDGWMMRIVDVISVIPLTLYVILIMVWLDSGFMSIIIAISSVYWVNMARIVRGQILSLKQQEFVLAAQTIGTSTFDILLKHLIPNCLGPIIVTATMLIPTAIFVEAFMGFLGLGVAVPMASWGTMCNDALATMKTTPYQLFFPAGAICITMFAFNFIGDGLRDALDPKLK